MYEIGEALQQLKQIKRLFAISTKHLEACATCLMGVEIDMKRTNNEECSHMEKDF